MPVRVDSAALVLEQHATGTKPSKLNCTRTINSGVRKQHLEDFTVSKLSSITNSQVVLSCREDTRIPQQHLNNLTMIILTSLVQGGERQRFPLSAGLTRGSRSNSSKAPK